MIRRLQREKELVVSRHDWLSNQEEGRYGVFDDDSAPWDHPGGQRNAEVTSAKANPCTR